MKWPDFFDKFLFCLKGAGGILSFTRLVYFTKLYSLKKENPTGDPEADFRIRFRVGKEYRRIRLRKMAGDIDIFYEVHWRKTYRLPLTEEEVRTVVDLGSNTGMSVLWWASAFPSAGIVAVEPDPDNFTLLAANTQSLPQVNCLQAAIGNQDGHTSIRRSRYLYNSCLDKDGDIPAEMLCMPSLMGRLGIDSIDLLKVDIEGAERLVFSGDLGWLKMVKHIVMELHEGCEDLQEIILANGFSKMQRTGFENGLYFFSR